MPKVSVVVPVYNVKDYLEKCAASVLGQTHPDLELLLIDDGSTDGSAALCDQIAASDPRVRVVHQENQGLGGARNTGVNAAQGQWILFPDSDDWLEPQTLETALSAGEKTGADLVAFPFRSEDEAGRELAVFREDLPENVPLDPKTRRDLLLLAPSACNKLYKTQLFHCTGLRYPPRVWYEDLRTTLKLIPSCRRLAYTGFVGYNYLQRPGSIMNNANLSRNREIIDALGDVLGWYKSQGLFEAYRQELEYLALFHGYLTASVRVLRADPSHPLLKELRAYIDREFPRRRHNPYLPRLGKKRRLLLSLLDRSMYRTVGTLFKLKG